MATIIGYDNVQYSGSWSLSSIANAKALGTWPTQPQPYLYVWGENSDGQLGLGNRTNYSSPKQLGTLTTWITLAGGTNSNLGIKSDGTLWMWGGNTYGQLGLGNTTKYSSPKQVGALTNWIAAAGTYYAFAAIKTDGTLWTWGLNDSGQLGLGNQTAYSSPKQVGSLTDWSKISGDNYCMFAVKTDGTLWSWGGNYWGNLGVGSSGNYFSSPKQVGSLTNWLTVAAGGSATTAIKTDGTLWTWGYNGYGNLGLGGTTTSYSSPKQIGALTNWSSVSSACLQSVHAIKTDNTLWAWGLNSSGTLGTSSTTNVVSPVQIGTTDWSKVKHSYGGTISIKTNGTLWTWGTNNYGQSGLGNTTSYSSPKQVGSLTTWGTISDTRGNNILAIVTV